MTLSAGIMAVMGAGLLGRLAGANLAQWVFGGVAGRTVLGGIAGGYLCVIFYNRLPSARPSMAYSRRPVSASAPTTAWRAAR